MIKNLSKKTKNQLGLMVLSFLMLGGCGQVAVQPYPSVVVPVPSPTSPPDVVSPTVVEEQFIVGDYARLEEVTAEGRPAAVHQLIGSARSAWQEGYTNEALQKFNRAIRISPGDGLIYFYLASISLEGMEPQKAASLARRGLSLSRNPILRQQLEILEMTAMGHQAI